MYIYDVLRAIYAVRPDLVPEQLQERESKAANKGLTPVMSQALRQVASGEVEEEVKMLRDYAATETLELHRKVALEEVMYFRKERG